MPAPMVAVIAEDDHDTRELIRLVLEQSGFEVVMVDDGAGAIAAVREHNPMLTTLDVNMPGIDGFAAAKRLREFSQTYLIMITSFDSEVDVIRGFEAGADDYLVKPFRPRELRARADSMIRRARFTEQATAPAPPAQESWAAAAAREFRESMDGVPAQADGGRPEPRLLPEAPATTRPAAAQPPAPQPVQQPAPPVQQPAQPMPQPAAPAEPSRVPVPRHVAPPAVPAAAEPSTAPGVVVEGELIRYGSLTIDTTSARAVLEGRPLDLNGPETEILLALLRTGRRVRSRADLVLAVRGQQFVTSYFVNEADKRAVDGHVASLKRKLNDEGTPARFIEPVKGVGYRLVPLG